MDSKMNTQADIRLLDMTGREVLALGSRSIATGESRISLDMSGVSNGSYVLSIRGEGSVVTAPVQVAH
jgi:hypothetical protein